MIDTARLAVFIPTFFMVSITPGMCMTLALSLGMSIGFRKTLWMMAGELTGVALVSTLTVIGISGIMIEYPSFFIILKIVGAGYLLYCGLMMWFSKGKMALKDETSVERGGVFYTIQGFVTAVANPKGWAFIISLLPPFINPDIPLLPQMIFLVSIILFTEFICLVMYAKGGDTLKNILKKQGKVRQLNKISGSVIIIIAFWLAFF